VYVTSTGANRLGVFSFDSTSGFLANVAAYATNSSYEVVVDPTGRFVYTAGSNSLINMWSINTVDGTLNNLGTISSGGFSYSLAIHPSGRFLYADVWSGSGPINIYSINQNTGILSNISSYVRGSIDTGGSHRIKIDPTGRFLYATRLPNAGGGITQYSINQATGEITPVANLTSSLSGNQPIVIDTFGRFLYTSNYSESNIVQYALNNFSASIATITQANVNVLYANTIYTNLPSVLNDITNQFDNLKCVFNLKLDQANVTSIVDSKNLEVVVNGSRLSPYVKQTTYPWVVTYDSYKGYRIVSSNTQTNLIIYSAPAPGDQATVTIINNSSAPQIRKYPFSAATIALGD
jgi:6-phosphogluconolactonase (cycloisomerase 2 family)